MIPVEQITEEVLQERFDSLPKNLQDALTSDRLVDATKGICTKYHFAGAEKQEVVQQIAGLVLLGFIHSSDVASELNEYFQLDPRLGASIAADLDAKIFSPFRIDLERNFSPLLTGNEQKETETMPLPVKIVPETITTEEVKKSSVPLPTPAPQPPQAPTTTSMPTPGKGPETQVPKPVILQETSPVEMNKRSSEFHIEISEDKFEGLSSVPRPAPQKAAVLELGSLSPVLAPKNAGGSLKPITEKYEGEFGSFSSKPAQAQEKNRVVMEITASSHVAPQPPAPVIPTPPAPEVQSPLNVPEKNPGTPLSKNIPMAPISVPLPSQISGKNIEKKFPAPIQASLLDKNTFAPMPLITAATPIPAPRPPLPVTEKSTFLNRIPSPSFVTPPTALRSSFFSKIFKKEPGQLIAIQKNYSEADMPPKTPVPSGSSSQNSETHAAPIAPLPIMPIPPKKI